MVVRSGYSRNLSALEEAMFHSGESRWLLLDWPMRRGPSGSLGDI